MSNDMSIFGAAKKAYLFDVWDSLHLHMKSTSGVRAHSSTCPSCSEAKSASSSKVTLDNEKGLWYCFACGAGGDVINLVEASQGLTALEAAEWITKQSRDDFKEDSNAGIAAKPKYKKRVYEIDDEDRRKARALTILASEGAKLLCPVTVQYLTGRGIPRDVIKANWRKRLIGTSTISPSKMMEIALLMLPKNPTKKEIDIMYKSLLFRPVVFLYRNESGIVTSAEFRSVKKSAATKSIRRGKAELPWILNGNNDDTAIVEGCIDALSLQVLGFSGTIISVPGVQCWRDSWKKQIKGNCWLSFDSDKAGNNASEKLDERLAGISTTRRKPTGANDWNELLMQKLPTM